MWLYDNIAVPRIRHVPWAQVVAASLVAEWITAVVAIFGTTISPYLFFWRRLPPRPRPRWRCVPWPGSAFALFSAGIIGTGLLAVPVLAGSAAYAMAGAMRWRNSLESPFSSATKFYAIIIAATLAGTALCFTSIDPMRALYWSAVLNGVIAVPVMVVVMLLAVRKSVMGEFVISRRLRVLGWLCTGVMALAVVAMFATLG